jgi:hypothetical protein
MGFNPGSRGFIKNAAINAGINIVESKLGQHNINTPYFLKMGAGHLISRGLDAGFEKIDQFHSNLQTSQSKFKHRRGCETGVVFNGGRSFTNCANESVTYSLSNSSNAVTIGDCASRIYSTYYHIGKSSSGNLYKKGKDKLVDTKVLLDTDRDYLDTNSRRTLTSTFGFNQKCFDVLLSDSYMAVKDYHFLYKDHLKNYTSRLATVNLYGDIFYERTKLTIKSETDHYSVTCKIHLAKILTLSVNPLNILENTFTNDLSATTSFKIPIERQLSVPVIHQNFRGSVLTDLKATLGLSDWFSDNVKIIKTFTRTLGPSDIWKFEMYHHLGPGILLNRINENYSHPEIANHPVGYILIVECMGDPRASLTRLEDGENFNGRSPGRITYSFEKSIKFIREGIDADLLESLTCRSFLKNDEDWENDSFKKYFSPNREEKINIDYSKVNVNRFPDKKKDYSLRYGEGRLAVYIEPELANYIKNNNSDGSDSKTWSNSYNSNEDEVVEEEPLNLDDNDENDLNSKQKSLRRSLF